MLAVTAFVMLAAAGVALRTFVRASRRRDPVLDTRLEALGAVYRIEVAAFEAEREILLRELEQGDDSA